MAQPLRRTRSSYSVPGLELLESRTFLSIAPSPIASGNHTALSERAISRAFAKAARAKAHARVESTKSDAPPASAAAPTNPENPPPAGALPGDANNDGAVDATDLGILASNYGRLTTAGTASADFNFDGVVNTSDLGILATNYGRILTVPATYDWHTQVIDGTLNVWASNPVDLGNTFTASSPTDLFGPDGIPSMEAIHQGPIADCYFLAAIGSMAYRHPSQIINMVRNDPNGGYAVTFYYSNNTGQQTPVIFHTDNRLSSTWQNFANGEVWSLVMEKAYAAFRTWDPNTNSSTNSMLALGWGYPALALWQVGEFNQNFWYQGQSEQAIYDSIASQLAQSHPVLFQTSYTATTMVASHVYIVTAVSTDPEGTRMVTTYNPWGFYETRTESELLNNGVNVFLYGNT